MRILFLGDVVGRIARQTVLETVADIRTELQADFVVVNVENSAGGFGVTPDIADQFLAVGVDVMTTGNHVWDKREIFAYIDKEPRLIRPINMPEGTSGKGMVTVTKDLLQTCSNLEGARDCTGYDRLQRRHKTPGDGSQE